MRDLWYVFLICDKLFFLIVTRQTTKSVKLSAIMALLVFMAIGIDQAFADHESDRQIYEFSELLDGVAAEVSTTQIQLNAVPDSSATLPTELIVAQSAYLEAFDEVIQKQII